jgi:hypothetical protein
MSLTTMTRTTMARMMMMRMMRTRTMMMMIIATRPAKKLPRPSLHRRNLDQMTAYA